MGARLLISGHSWELSSGKLVKIRGRGSDAEASRFVLERTNTVAFELYCREKVDVYDWSLEVERLFFRTVGRPCDRAARAVLTSGRWRRV